MDQFPFGFAHHTFSSLNYLKRDSLNYTRKSGPHAVAEVVFVQLIIFMVLPVSILIFTSLHSEINKSFTMKSHSVILLCGSKRFNFFPFHHKVRMKYACSVFTHMFCRRILANVEVIIHQLSSINLIKLRRKFCSEIK